MNDENIIQRQLRSFNQEIDPKELFPTLLPEAADFVLNNPYAFAMAISLDRGTKAEIIWTIPYYIYQQLGHLDPYEIDLLSLEDLEEVISKLPKKPRYKTAAPRTIKELTSKIISDFEGEASRIWTNKSSSEVNNFFQSIFGVGPGIANMAVLLIEKAYHIQFSDLDRKGMDIKPDVHTMRVLYRLGAAEEISEGAAVNAARKLNPDFPGEIDGPLWTIGREWCFAQNPACSDCPMGEVCRKTNV
jgi:endonuclease III